jgi:hypothetical protein
MDASQQRLTDCLPVAEALCRALRDEAKRLGFDAEALAGADPLTAEFRLQTDPASGDESLLGEWFDRHRYRVGMLLFHADGSFFAEHDVVRPHPGNQRLFVEALEAWGRGQDIRCEARVMPMLDDASAADH